MARKIAAGTRTSAMVVGEGVFNPMPNEDLVSRIADLVEIRTFRNKEEANNWIFSTDT